MKAAWVSRTGGPEVIRYGGLPVPDVQPGTVLVRVAASAVNHVDNFVRNGKFATALTFPQVVGRDLVGTVETVGPGVQEGFRPGDAVWSNSMGFGGRHGAGAEFSLVPAERLYRLPAGIGPVAAVAVLHAGASAHLALHRHGRLQPGETVFVGGAAGGVGSAAVVQAVRAGAKVIASAAKDDAGHVLAMGASAALDYRSPAFADELRAAVDEVSGGHGLDLHLETSGRHQLELVVGLLAPRGRIIAMSGLDASNSVPLGKLYTRDGSIRGFAISNATVEDLARAAKAVNELLADGSLRARAVTKMPLSDAAAAHASLESGTVHGKLVLVP